MGRLRRPHLVGAVNLLLARTEADLLSRFPGDTDRVRTLLNPTRRESTERDVVAETGTPSEP